MADHASHGHAHEAHGEHAHHPNYVKIWAILLVLLAVSVAGPMLEIQAVTLITAFGIALVKESHGSNWSKPSWMADTAHPSAPAADHPHEEAH